MAMLTVFGILAGIASHRVTQYRQKSQALERLKNLLAEVSPITSYAIPRIDARQAPGWEPLPRVPWSEWIAGRFPSLDVVVIGFGSPSKAKERFRSTAEVFESLRDFPTIAEAELENSDVVDTDICVLAATCPGLTRLKVNSTRLTDASFPCIAKFRALKVLEMSYTQITGVGIRAVVEMCPHLEYLDVSSSRITDEGLAEIAACTSLKELNISGNQPSVTGINILESANLQNLRRLSLVGASYEYGPEQIRSMEKTIQRLQSRFPDLEVEYSIAARIISLPARQDASPND